MKNIFRLITLLFISSTVLISGCTKKPDTTDFTEIKIGHQKSGPLVYLKNKKWLEEKLAKHNIKVSWIEFSSGPPILEALNTGSIDFCTTGETPPVFAQAAGIEFYYIAQEPASPETEAIIVPENSNLHSLDDLKGKKVAVTKGSSAHYALTKALEKINLKYDDITPVFLQPSDARAAFEKGSVDAWVIWEPYLSAAEQQLNAKILATGLKSNTWYYLASKNITDENPELIRLVVEKIWDADVEITKNPEEFAGIVSQLTGLPEEITLTAAKRQHYGIEYLDEVAINEQQQTANTFYNLQLILNPVKVEETIWHSDENKLSRNNKK